MVNKNRFSIITVHRNGIDRLRTFLKSAALTIDFKRDIIIVVDNHSLDDSIEIAEKEFPTVKFIKNNYNMGYAYACNQGIQNSKSEFILICNNDLILPPNILEKLEADFKNYSDAGLIGGQLINNHGELSTSAGNDTTLFTELGFKKNKRLYPTQKITEVESIVGACMAARQVTINKAGMLDPAFFFYYEESEWCYRIRQFGWKIFLDSEIRVTHTGGASTKTVFLGARIEYHRSRLHYWKKVFPNYYHLLLIYTTVKMLGASIYYTAAWILGLGQSTKIKNKLFEKVTLLTWLGLGKPKHWGLPDKPPSNH
jgi:GT2 family glycosyltransferase